MPIISKMAADRDSVTITYRRHLGNQMVT